MHLCLCFVSTGKKSYEEYIEFWLYMHVKVSEVSEMYWKPEIYFELHQKLR